MVNNLLFSSRLQIQGGPKTYTTFTMSSVISQQMKTTFLFLVLPVHLFCLSSPVALISSSISNLKCKKIPGICVGAKKVMVQVFCLVQLIRQTYENYPSVPDLDVYNQYRGQMLRRLSGSKQITRGAAG